MSWKIYLDGDWERAGFSPESIEQDGVAIGYSERLSALATLTVVVTYLGGQLLDKATDGALSKSIDRLFDFARSKEARLKIEFEELKLDPRIKVVMARIESVDREELSRAIQELPMVGPTALHLIEATTEFVQEMYFVWDGEKWIGTYYLTEGGEVVSL